MLKYYKQLIFSGEGNLTQNVIRITPPNLRGPAFHRILIIFLLFLLGSCLLFSSSATFIKAPEEIFRDWVIQTNANMDHTAEQRVVIVDIDEASIREVGAWPWPRNIVAELIENLVTDYEAKAVGVDVVFPEHGDTLGDGKIAALAQFAPVVLSQVFDFSERTSRLSVGTLAGHDQLPGIRGKTQATGFIANHDGFAQAPFVGNIGFEPDQDGNLRRASFVVSFQGNAYPSLSLSIARLTTDFPLTNPVLGSEIRIPFRKPLTAYTVIPAHRVLERSVGREFLSGKVVLIGSSSLGLGDRVATPLNPQTSGVFVHAALYTGLIDGYPTALQKSDVGPWLGLLWLLLVCSLALMQFNRQSATRNIAIVLGAAIIWLAVAAWLSSNLIEANIGAPFVVLLGLLLVLVPYDWQTSQNQSKFLMKTLKHHISPTLANELIKSGLQNPLAPRTALITVLVADVENYTGRISTLTPQAVAELTRGILNLIGQAAMSTRGTIDKFTGDGGVAFWGAPLPMIDHADLAIEAGLAILEKVRKFNQDQMDKGLPPLRVRLGIDSGEVIVGDFGWSERATYTAIGQCMGRAARLEQLGKKYEEDLIVGSNTVELCRKYTFEQIDSPILRGLQEKVDIFRVKPPAGQS